MDFAKTSARTKFGGEKMPFIKNQNIELYYEVVGKGMPIIFHHGYGNSVQDWHELGYVDALKDDYQLILFDERGFGKSSKPHDSNQYTYELRTSDTILLLDHLGIERAVAFGNSMGGKMVYALMHFYPERFNCFIAAGNHPYGQTDLGNEFKIWLEHGIEYTVKQIETKFAPFPRNLRERYLANDAQAMLAAYPTLQEDLSYVLPKITVPVFLYAGSEDPVVPGMREAVKSLKNGELKLMQEFDHAQAYWRGDLAGELIKEFLGKYL